MTKSNQKATIGSVLTKVKNDNDPYYIKVEDLVLDNETLSVIKRRIDLSLELLSKQDKLHHDNTVVLNNKIISLENELKAVKNDLQRLEDYIKDKIREWVEL